jgi:BirA family biotin operon repressor/biotin-[acetyl-CoA-carboxylase] ligase
MFWQFEAIGQAMGLSLAVGIACRKVIAQFTDDQVKVKWPNDLLIEQQKIAGILIEIEGQADGPCGVVIGIGINVNMPDEQALKIAQPWTDMSAHCTEPPDRNQLIAHLVAELHNTLIDFEQQGLNSTVEQWNNHDHYYAKPIKLIMGNRTVEGICQGIDKQGGVLIKQTDTQTTTAYYGGEVSLRALS